MNKKNLVDIFDKDATVLIQKKLWLFDMDGTIYNENTLFEGALDLLNRVVKNGGRYVFITNNSSKSLNDYIRKVNQLGIDANENNFFTSVQATALLLKDKFPNTKVYCQGTESMLKELIDSGLDVVSNVQEGIGVVVVGFDTELTSSKIQNTCLLLQKDIPFFATNCDLRCPVSFGYIPDCGSICQMITNATERKPIFIGKPEPTMAEYAMLKFGFTKEETVVIGDRLYTDIAIGNKAGITSVCVLTGEARLNDIANSDIKPSFVFNSVKDILI